MRRATFVGENARREILHEEFHPFGTSAYRSGDATYDVSPKRYRYTGKERDDETGLDYHGLRYRVPWLGRWSTADPLGLIDGPNLYAYALNNPIAVSDPSGSSAVGSSSSSSGSGEGNSSDTIKGKGPTTSNAPAPGPPTAKPAPPAGEAAAPGPEPGAPQAPAAPEAPQPTVPRVNPGSPTEASPPTADSRTQDQALAEGFAEGLTGFRSVGEAWDTVTDPETWIEAAPHLLSYQGQPIMILGHGLVAMGKGAIELGEDLGRLQDESLTIEQRAEAGGRAVGKGVKLLGEAVALGGIFGTPRLPSTPSTTPKFNLLDQGKLREPGLERRGRRFQDLDDALDQLDGISREQDLFRRGVRKDPIDSIEKSQRRATDAARRLAAKTRTSLEKLAAAFEDVRHYLKHGRQPTPEEHR